MFLPDYVLFIFLCLNVFFSYKITLWSNANFRFLQDYTGLFEISTNTEDNLDDILHSRSLSVENRKERPSFSSAKKEINLANFSTNQVFFS